MTGGEKRAESQTETSRGRRSRTGSRHHGGRVVHAQIRLRGFQVPLISRPPLTVSPWQTPHPKGRPDNAMHPWQTSYEIGQGGGDGGAGRCQTSSWSGRKLNTHLDYTVVCSLFIGVRCRSSAIAIKLGKPAGGQHTAHTLSVPGCIADDGEEVGTSDSI